MRAWETLIPSVVSRHYEAVVAQGVGYEGSTWRGGTEQSWQWLRTVVTRPGKHNLIVHGHDTIFKAHHVQIQQNVLWIFDCRRRGSDGPRKTWVMTDYSAIIHRVMVWMGAMPRWNILLLLPPKHTYQDVVRKLELPMTSIPHCAHWYFRDHTQARGIEVKHSGRVVGSYDPFGDVVVISYRPQGSDPSDNFVCVDGKFKLSMHFVEPEWPWAALACDLQARSPSLIEQALDAFLPDGWTLVVQGLSVIVPEFEGSRAQRIVVLEGNADRETFVKRWASRDKHVRAVVQSTGVSTEEDLDD